MKFKQCTFITTIANQITSQFIKTVIKASAAILLVSLTIPIAYGQGLHVEQGTSNSSTQTGGYLWVGDKSNQHLSFDQNEIQARFDFGDNTLLLNPHGGRILMLQQGNTAADLNIDGDGLFYDNSLDRVGLGTLSPSETLDVEGNTRTRRLKLSGAPNTDDGYVESVEGLSADLFFVANDNIRFDLDNNNDESGELEVFNGANQKVLSLTETGGMDVKGNQLRISTLSNSKYLSLSMVGNEVDLLATNADLFLTAPNHNIVIAQSGNTQVGVGDTAPSYKLELGNFSNNNAGQVRAYDFDTYSDRRIKSNFRQLKNATDIIMELNPLSYDHFDSDVENGEIKIRKNKSTKDVGFVAQDMYDVLPDLVYKPENETNDLWSISYIRLIPYLTKAIQEQQGLIEEQFSMIRELKTEMKNLSNSKNQSEN